MKMEMERFEVYVDVPPRCGLWCGMKTIGAATKFLCTPQPLAPSTPRTAALHSVSDQQIPLTPRNPPSKSSVLVSTNAQAEPSSGKFRPRKKHTPHRRLEGVRRGMARLSIQPERHGSADGGLSVSSSASSGRGDRNLSRFEFSLSGEDSEFQGTNHSPLLASIIKQTITDPSNAAEDGAMQTETSSGVGSDLPTSEYEFHVLVDEPPLQTSTPVDTIDLPTSEYEFHVLSDEPPLQTSTPVDTIELDPLRTDLPGDGDPDEAQAPPATSVSILSLVRLTIARTAEEAPGENQLNHIEIDVTTDEAPQGAGGGPVSSRLPRRVEYYPTAV